MNSNECGYVAPSIDDLQLHLQRKTAWSNQSLVGCRISCLVDYKEWHEGYVTQLHKSGKHFVEFRLVNEKRWLHMRKISFYIVERPPNKPAALAGGGVDVSSEFKETNTPRESDGLAPIDDKDNWVYCEDISADYAFAQSILFKIYGNSIQETGHLTRGHVCLTDSDRRNAVQVKSSLLYGELLPRGVNKALGSSRLAAGSASVLFDLGMGTGKVLIQAFLQFKNLRYAYGVELSSGRYKVAEDALLKTVHLLGAENYQVQVNPGKFIIVRESISSSCEESDLEMECSERVLHFECGNIFDIKNISIADIVMMETDFPADLHPDLYQLLSRMQEGSRLLTYLDLRRISKSNSTSDDREIAFNTIFKQIDCNKHLSDRYPTSWSVQRGHHFFLWNRFNQQVEQASTNSTVGTTWGHGFGVGIFSHHYPSSAAGNGVADSHHSAKEPQSSTAQLSGKLISTEKKSSESNRCLPFGLGYFLPSFLKGKPNSPSSAAANSATGKGPANASASTVTVHIVNPQLKDRTVIPINIDGLRGGTGKSSPTVIKIPAGGVKPYQSNYPNYIERAANVRDPFISSSPLRDHDAENEHSDRGDDSDFDSSTDGHRSPGVSSDDREKDRSKVKDRSFSSSSGHEESPRPTPRSNTSGKKSTKHSHGSRTPRKEKDGATYATPKKSHSSSKSNSSARSTPRDRIHSAGSNKSSSRSHHSKSNTGNEYRPDGIGPNAAELEPVEKNENVVSSDADSPSDDTQQLRIEGTDEAGPLPFYKFTPVRGSNMRSNSGDGDLHLIDSPRSVDDENSDTAQRYYMTGNHPYMNSMTPSPMGPPNGSSQPIFSHSLSRGGTPTQLILASYTDQHMHSPISLDGQFAGGSTNHFNHHFPALHLNSQSNLVDQDMAALPFSNLGLNYSSSNPHGKSYVNHSNGVVTESMNASASGFLLCGKSDSTISEADG